MGREPPPYVKASVSLHFTDEQMETKKGGNGKESHGSERPAVFEDASHGIWRQNARHILSVP